MAGNSALQPVQAIVYQTLSADGALTALAPVYDEVPAGTGFPYITMGEFLEEPNDTLGGKARTVTATLYAWSKKPGYKELESILEELIRILDLQTLPNPVGWQTWENVYETGELGRLDDGLTRQLITRFRIEVQA